MAPRIINCTRCSIHFPGGTARCSFRLKGGGEYDPSHVPRTHLASPLLDRTGAVDSKLCVLPSKLTEISLPEAITQTSSTAMATARARAAGSIAADAAGVRRWGAPRAASPRDAPGCPNGHRGLDLTQKW